MSEKQNNLRAYIERLLDERVRSYVVVVVAALLVILVSGLISGSSTAGLVPALIGLVGLVLRGGALPIVCVISVAYFQFLPFGVPIVRPVPLDPRFTHFRIQDLFLVSAVLVYLIAQYRLFSLTHRVVPDDNLVKVRHADRLPPEIRDPALVDEREIPQLLVVMAAALLLGQLAWLFLSETILEFRNFQPVQLRPSGLRGSWVYTSREIVFALGLGLTVFFGRLGFWLWRLKTLNPLEAQLILADTGWAEMRREAARLETWRAYGKDRAREKVVVPAAKRKPKRRKPWLAAALGRACLTVFVASIIAILLVCGGSYLFLSLVR